MKFPTLNGSGGGESSPPPATEPSNGFKKPQKRTLDKLNKEMLDDAEALVSEWTGGEVDTKGDELQFLNTTRGDTTLGSCSINLSTGNFQDFADESFAGHGMLQLYACLQNVSVAEAVDNLRTKPARKKRPIAQKPKPKPKPEVVPEPVDESNTDIPLPPDMHAELGIPDTTYTYRNADGDSVFLVHRFQTDKGKETRPLTWDGKAWQWRYPTKDKLPLYNLDKIVGGGQVLVCEGEKAADAAAAMFPGYAATTSARGSSQAEASEWSPLKDAKVLILPDNDAPGRKYAIDVAGFAIVCEAAEINVVDVWQLEGWLEGDDVADHLDLTEDFLQKAVPAGDVFEPKELEPGIVKAA